MAITNGDLFNRMTTYAWASERSCQSFMESRTRSFQALLRGVYRLKRLVGDCQLIYTTCLGHLQTFMVHFTTQLRQTKPLSSSCEVCVK